MMESRIENNLSRSMAWALGVSNWTSNMTYTTPQSLLEQVSFYHIPPDLTENKNSWYRTYPATVAFLFLLHVVFLVQWNYRMTKSQCFVTYRQLIHAKQYYRAIVAIFSHPPATDQLDYRRRSVSIFDYHGNSTAVGEGGLLSTCHAQLKEIWYSILNGNLSGIPLLAYNSHLLWSCRALEPTFPSSWYYMRSLLAMAFLAMALELRLFYNLLPETPETSTSEFGITIPSTRDIQPDWGADVRIRLRTLLVNRQLGTCTALIHAVIFLFSSTFNHASIPILPIIDLPWSYPKISFGLCTFFLIAASHRHHAVTSFLSGTTAAFLWICGFHFLGQFYWSFCWLGWLSIASFISLRFPGIHTAWDSQGRIRFEEGVENSVHMTSFSRDNSATSLFEEGDEMIAGFRDRNLYHPEDYDFTFDSQDLDDSDNSIVDVENTLLHRRRMPFLESLEDSDGEYDNMYSQSRLTRRGTSS